MTANPVNIPTWKKVDILVLGSTIAAVSAALAARASGREVALLGEENFLGQDFAGDLHLWERESVDPLVRTAMASCLEYPARPAAIKRHLEQHLLHAGIPFIYGVRPVGLLTAASGEIHGVIAAARTSLFGVLAPQVIDASAFGLGARLANLPLEKRPSDIIAWRILATKDLSALPWEVKHLPSPYRQTFKEQSMEFQGLELGISRKALATEQKNLEHLVRASLIDEAVCFSASHLIDPGSEQLATVTPRDSLSDFSEEDFQAAPGLWLANRLLPVRDLSSLTDPSQMSRLGKRVAEVAASKDTPAAPAKLRFQSGSAGSGGSYSFSKVFLRNPGADLVIESLNFPTWEEFDVVVAGGGTAGAPAAIASARAGAKTLCLESAHGLGGVGTLGMISSYWFGNKVGFTAELNGTVSMADSMSRSKNGNVWQPEVKSATYHRMLSAANGQAWMKSFVFGVRLTGSRPEGVLVSTPFGCGYVPAKTFVDATGNADLAAACGAPCQLIDKEHMAVQGTGISPRVYPSVSHQNSDHTFVEENDPEGITAAFLQAREKYPNDFETAPFVNSRERRQIQGDLEISPLDILAGRTFPDTIFTAKSNFDTHGFIIHPVFMVSPPDHKPLSAHVPLRCMLPKHLEGLLVTGLGMSAHRDAIPVIRMQADVQNQGYAAGLLAAQCAASGEHFREIDIRKFQRVLVENGILAPEVLTHNDSFPLSSEDLNSALQGDLSSAKNVAISFAHPELSQPILIDVMSNDPDHSRRDLAALILGFMGSEESREFLEGKLDGAVWDDGWNYRGMGQFGASMSQLDAVILALTRCGTSASAELLVPLVKQLNVTAAFSHCRCLALAAATFKNPKLSMSLCGLLDLPGFTGHAMTTPAELLSDSDGDPTSTKSRNLALRELYVGRGLFLGGNDNGRGRQILEQYKNDLRGHFARHARAVLASGGEDLSIWNLA